MLVYQRVVYYWECALFSTAPYMANPATQVWDDCAGTLARWWGAQGGNGVIGDGMRNAGRKPMGCCHKLPFKTIQWSLETRIALLSVVILYSHYIPTISLEYPGICPWIPAVVFTGSSFGWEFCQFSEACMEAFAMWGEKEEDGETCLGLTEFHYQSLSGG